MGSYAAAYATVGYSAIASARLRPASTFLFCMGTSFSVCGASRPRLCLLHDTRAALSCSLRSSLLSPPPTRASCDLAYSIAGFEKGMYGIPEAQVGFDSPNPLPPRLRCPSSPWPSSSLEPLDARPHPPRCPAPPSSNPHGHAGGSRCRSAVRRPGGVEGQLEGGVHVGGSPRCGSNLSSARSAPYPRWEVFPPGPPAQGEPPAERPPGAGAQPRRRLGVPTPSPVPSWGATPSTPGLL
jgi:hypothetical protein